MSSIDLFSILPLLVLACGAVAVLMAGSLMPGRSGTVIGMATLAAAAWCTLLLPVAGTPSTLGIAVSPFSRFFLLLFELTGLAVLLLSVNYNDRRGIVGEEYTATLLFAVFAMGVLCESSNFLPLFLGLEGLTFAFYFLVAIDLERPESGEAGLKYLIMGAVSAAFIAFGIALVYGGSGTLDVARALVSVAQGVRNPLLLGGLGFILAGAAFKISLAPAHLWTPDVYEGAPAPVVAFLSTASKGASIVFLLIVLQPAGVLAALRIPLWGLAFLSMLVGNLAALLQQDLKRMLAYSAIAQMGYIAVALLAGRGGGFPAAAFYVMAYTAMNLAAFGAVSSLTDGREFAEIENYRGLGYRRPLQGGVLALAMFALAGIPPTAGFAGKFLIFSAALRGGETALAVFGIVTAAVSAYYYLRVVVNLYMRPADKEVAAGSGTVPENISLIIAALAIVVFGVFPGSVMALTASFFR